MEFKIGDKIRIKKWEDIPESRKTNEKDGVGSILWYKSKSRLCGMTGTIIDRMFSEQENEYLYRVKWDETGERSSSLFTSDVFCIANEMDEFRILTTLFYNGVRITMVDGNGKEIASGFGKFFHNNEEGYAQAVSFAAKKLYENLYNKTEDIL